MILFHPLASQLQAVCLEKGLTLATAESCTAGLLSATLVHESGSSGYFLGGVVSYSNEAKRNLLNVSGEAIDTFGAVSPEVAHEMAEGARRAFSADAGISITGVAGPGGGTVDKPVGLTYIGLSDVNEVSAFRFDWEGDRDENRWASVEAALKLLLAWAEDYR